jgi:predicted transposase YbfD/YdcC
LKASIGGLFPPDDYFESVEKAHGRIEERKIRVLDTGPFFSAFPFINQVIQIERIRTIISKGKVEKETVYCITSAHRSEAGPERLANIARNQWKIEANHYIRDVIFAEDASRLRKGNAAQVMATFRNLVMAILRLTKNSGVKIAKTIRAIGWNKKIAAIKLIGLV